MPETTQMQHRNGVLDNFAVRFRPPARRWDEVLRIIPVMEKSDDYAVFDRNLFEAGDDVRAEGGEAKPSDIGWKFDTYQCKGHARKAKLTNEARKRAADQGRELNSESRKIEQVKVLVENNIELATFGPSGLLRTAANNAGSADANWSNKDTCSPRTDINTGRIAVKKASGHAPNTIVGTMESFLWITGTAEYKSQVAFFENIAVTDGVPEVLYGMKTVVVDSQVNTNNKGQSKTPNGFLFGYDIWLGYVAPGDTGIEQKDGGFAANQLETEIMTYAALFSFDEIASSWYEDGIKSTWFEYERVYDIKPIAKECGYLMTDWRS